MARGSLLRIPILTGGILAAGWRGNALAQEDLTGRAILSYQTLGGDLLSGSSFHQTYDLRLERSLTDFFRYRLSFRGEANDGTTQADGAAGTKATFRQYEPGAEVHYVLAAFQFQGLYDDIRTTAASGGLSDAQTMDRLLAQLTWRPDSLPVLTLQGEHRHTKDALAGLDSTETTVTESLDYTWKGFGLGENVRLQTLDDGHADFARKTTDWQGLGRYDGSFFGGRALVSANLLAAFTRLDERATSGQAVSIPIRVTIPRALYARDDTPLDDRDKPLADLPALVDGDFARAAGIPLGPDGASYQNVGVDMGRFVQLDTLSIHVRDLEGHAVKDGGFVRFDAYRSDDGVSWVPMPGGAQTTFSAAQSLYAVAFPIVTTRFVKVVSFGTNILDTQVTELEAFYHSSFAAGQAKRTAVSLGSGTATLVGKPTDSVTLSYYGLFNRGRQTSDGQPDVATSDWDQIVSLRIDPSRALSLTAQYEKSGLTQTAGYDQTADTASAILHYTPLKTLDASLQYLRSNQDLAGRLATSDGLNAHLTLRLLRSLDVSLDGGWSKEDTASDGHPATHRTLTAVSYAQLTDDLKLTTNASFQRTSYENGSPGDNESGFLLPASRDDRFWLEAYYRPGPQLALTTRFGYVSSDSYSGPLQQYRLEWYPFPGGSVSIGTIYDEDVDTLSNQHFRRVQILPRWTLNKHATIDLNYTVMGTYTGANGAQSKVTASSRNFWATVTLAF